MNQADQLSRVLERLDKVVSDVREIRICQAEIKKDLAYHIKRTDLAEEQLKQLKKDFEVRLDTTRTGLETQLKPIQKHVDGVGYIFKAIGVLSLLISLALAASKLHEEFRPKPAKGEKSNEVPEVRTPRKQRKG